MIFAGLEVSPITLKETMMPNISPEMAVDAAVQVLGGYDPSLFGVSMTGWSLLSNSWVGLIWILSFHDLPSLQRLMG